jgi:O-antigen ligase
MDMNGRLPVTENVIKQASLDVPNRVMTVLMLLFCFFTAAPLYDVPMVGISVTAPLAGLLVYAVLRDWHGLKLEWHKGFLFLLAVMYFALLVSWTWNIMAGGNAYGSFSASAKTMIRYLFWFLCAMLACRLFSRTALPAKATRAFAAAVVLMSGLVAVEYVLFGGLKSSGWSRLTTLSQNAYGVQYSTFLPFVYYAAVSSFGRRRLLWFGSLALCLFAVLALGSRSTWGTTLITLVLFAVLYAAFARRLGVVIAVAVASCLFGALGWQLLPADVKGDLVYEYESLNRLERDKSWQIRLLQIQKGQRIFAENPILGVGPSQYTRTYVELDIPEIMRYGNSANFSSRSAHNTYVALLAEGGLAFAVPYGLMLLWLCVAGMRSAVVLARHGELWGLAMVPSLAGMSIHFWTLSGLTGTAPWFLYGMTAAMIYRARWMSNAVGATNSTQANIQEGSFAARISLPYSR